MGCGFCRYDITTAEIDNLYGGRKRERQWGEREGGAESKRKREMKDGKTQCKLNGNASREDNEGEYYI